MRSSVSADATVLRALAAAGIPPERCGRERLRTLDDAERELYRWILRAFAAEGRPTAEATRAAASRIGADYEPALASFAEADLIHVVDGQIAVAYPFSGRPTAHRVEIDGNRVHAMCAVDALGIAAMLRRSIAVASTDPVDGTEVRVSVDADGSASWEPREAVVLAGRACDGTAFQGCCRVLNFFASPAAADGYLSEHRDLDGFPITIPEAVAFGRLVFGRVLDD